MGGFDSRRWLGALVPYLALVGVHLLSGLQMEQPLVLADEAGYLGNARYLSGVGHLPDMRGTGFYHFGYSLFLIPAFWLFAEPVSVYKAAVTINALLAAALYFPLHYILTSAVELPARPARWIAFACCLYPSLVLYSSLAWAESAFVPLFAAAVALFARLLARRTSLEALLFGLVVGLLYAIHPRALPIAAAAGACLVLLAVLRAIRWQQLLLGASAIAALLALTRMVNQHLKETGWGSSGELSAAKLVVRLVPDGDFPALLERAAGQLLYLSLASHGLFLVGSIAMVWLIVGRRGADSLREALVSPRRGVPLFILASGAGVFVAACTLKLYSLHGEQGVRGAEFIHGRYNEALAVLALAYGLAWLWQGAPRGRRLTWCVVVVVGMVLCLTLVVMTEVGDALRRQVAGVPGAEPRELVPLSQVDAVAVPGVYPVLRLRGGLDLYAAAAAAIGALALIVLTMRFSRRGGVALLIALFALFAYDNYRHYLLPGIARTKPRLAVAEELRRLGRGVTIGYDAAYREPGLVPAMQFLVPEAVFQRFDSRRGEVPPGEAVISDDDWPQAEALDARFVIASGRGGAMWLLPGEARSRLPAPAWEGVTLGATRRLDLQESGFYRQESFQGRPGRWTDGAASLRLPLDPARPPQSLEVETLAPGRDGTRLRVLANGVELWDGQIPREAWSRSFALEAVPLGEELLIELESDTFSPAEGRPGSRDPRRLGIVVTGIRLDGASSGPSR